MTQLCVKETLQIVRDPSALLMAFVFPAVLLIIFGSGINLDSGTVRMGIFNQDGAPVSRRLAAAFQHSPSFHTFQRHSTEELGDMLRAGRIRGFVVIGQNFAKWARGKPVTSPPILVVTDGSRPNTANFVASYTQRAYAVWAREEALRGGVKRAQGLALEMRHWFNPSTKSRNALLPGSITIIMTVVGSLLTALVIAREWERGTMEVLLSVGVTRLELVASKFIPYFALGQVAFFICVGMSLWVFGIPFRGTVLVLFLVSSAFLCSALGVGLLLSTVLRNQYNAAQAALNITFLPALMLSGFVFEINSMPTLIRAASALIPARYCVSALHTVFLAGDVLSVLARSLFGLTLAAFAFLLLTFVNTRRQLQ